MNFAEVILGGCFLFLPRDRGVNLGNLGFFLRRDNRCGDLRFCLRCGGELGRQDINARIMCFALYGVTGVQQPEFCLV